MSAGVTCNALCPAPVGEDAGEAVAFLCSEAGGAISGRLLPVGPGLV